jgi:hypothetical protein
MGQGSLKQLAERLLSIQQIGTTAGQQRDTACPTAPKMDALRGTLDTTSEGAANSFNSYRTLPPDELEKLDLRFRIHAPNAVDKWTLDDWLGWISERSAILEFDAEYSKEQADHEAMLIWKLYRRGEQ